MSVDALNKLLETESPEGLADVDLTEAAEGGDEDAMQTLTGASLSECLQYYAQSPED